MNKYTNVDEFLADLTEDRKQQVNALREIIRISRSDLIEHMKWNSPSYVLEGEDRITFNMHRPEQTMVIFHMGATRKENRNADPVMKDETGLIKWNSDIRGTIAFRSLEDIQISQSKVADLIKAWLSIK